MRAILVSVTYTDILRLTLPWNRHHFSSVLIVTSLEDYNNVLPVALANNAEVFGTDIFYQNGAKFNKWAALNEGLEHGGFHDCNDWVVVLDADTCWPRDLEHNDDRDSLTFNRQDTAFRLLRGQLTAPLRRMYPSIPQSIPDEKDWTIYPHHRYQAEFSGYTMVFHSSDPVLQKRPWFPNNWSHCGGGDNEFAKRWTRTNSIRPTNWDVLHIGVCAANWMGRTSRLADGSLPPNHETHQANIQKLWQSRRATRDYNNPIEKLL